MQENKPRIKVKLVEERELGWLDSHIEDAISCHYKIEKYLEQYEVYDDYEDKYVELDWWFDEFILYAVGKDYKDNLHVLASLCYDTGWCKLSEYIFEPIQESIGDGNE